MKEDKLRERARWVRQQVLEMAMRAGAGHIAPAYSCTEIMVALYQGNILRVRPKQPAWEDRDRFILSKGQACAAQYAILADMGYFPVSELKTYCRLGSKLGGHSESNVIGVEAFTGSLGHGLPIGTGMALAGKMDKKDYLVVVLLGDGEIQEGSNWEAAMFAAHHGLNKLIAIIDRNGLQALDYTEDVLSLEPLAKKWEAFGWETRTVNGHSFNDLLSVMGDLRSRKSRKPLVIIALTTKGKGVSFMENSPIWHFRIPDKRELIKARMELYGMTDTTKTGKRK